MKKMLLILFVLIFIPSIYGQDLSGVKIYVNPGHGGYDGANDRNVVTIPFAAGDTLGFWESSSNLTKGLHLRDLLQAENATVYMSRTLNRDEDDRSLSEIAEEANANRVDAFISIHSNAVGVNSGINYQLILYHGYDNDPTVAESLPQAKACWSRTISNELTYWSHYTTSMNLRGDFSFYGNTSGLGVLRPLTVPGFLIEGSFHDYGPEAHRLLNEDYRKLHAEDLNRYYCDYFNATLPSKGIIAGWVKGKDQRVNDSRFIYKAYTDDEWLPLNGATVTLKDDGGNILSAYQVDSLYNGIFAFYDLVPGSYRLTMEAKDHVTKDTTIVVEAAKTTFANVLLYNPDLPVYSEVPPDYPQPKQEAGVLPMNSYTFKLLKQEKPDWLDGASIRKAVYRDEKMYVLTEEPKIHIINASTFQPIREMDLTGVEGGIKPLSDINFTSDGTLLACNKDTIAFSESQNRYFKVYYWDNDSVAPQLLFQSQRQGNWSNGVVGETFAVTGAKWECSIFTPSVTTSQTKKIRILGFTHKKDAPLAYKYMIDNAYTEAKWGAKFKFVISPNASNQIVIDGENMLPTEYKFDWMAADRSPLELLHQFNEVNGYTLNLLASGINFHKNAKHTYMISPNCDENGANVGVVLFDIHDGLSNAKKVSQFLPENGLGTTISPYMTTFGKVEGYDQDLIVLATKEGVARYRTVTPKTTANVYASELKAKKTGDGFTCTFTLNDNIESGILSIYDDTDAIVYSVSLNNLTKGTQSINVPASDLPKGTHTWGLKINGANIDRPIKFTDNASKQLQFYSPRGVAVDNNFESAFFGRVYASETIGGDVTDRTTTDGIYILNAALEDITNQGANAYGGNVAWGKRASPMRLNVAPDGKVFLTDFSNANPGVWIMDPSNPAGDFMPVFSSALDKAESGLSSNGSVNVHGSISTCWITGIGENTKLYTFDEDYIDATATNPGNILQYNIGELTTAWKDAPSVIVYDDGANGNLQRNYNSSIAPDGRGGWWLSQFRATDNSAIPSLIHINTKGAVDFNSGKTPTLIGNSYTGGMAVNIDGTRLAMGCRDEVKIFDVQFIDTTTRIANDIPQLTMLYSIKPAMGAYTPGIAFDRAGNLYVISNTSERLGVWGLPKIENSFETMAPSSQAIVVSGTAIKKAVQNNDVEIFPNPFAANLTVKSFLDKIESVAIYDGSGRLILIEQMNDFEKSLPLSQLPSGVYILKVKTAKGIIAKRVMKK